MIRRLRQWAHDRFQAACDCMADALDVEGDGDE